MTTLDLHKLVTDGLRVDPSLRWGSSWNLDSKVSATIVTNVRTGDEFKVTIEPIDRH